MVLFPTVYIQGLGFLSVCFFSSGCTSDTSSGCSSGYYFKLDFRYYFWLHFRILLPAGLSVLLPVAPPDTTSGCNSGTTSCCTSVYYLRLDFRWLFQLLLPVAPLGTTCTSGCTSGIISGSTSGYYFKVKRVQLYIPFAKQAVRRGPFIIKYVLINFTIQCPQQQYQSLGHNSIKMSFLFASLSQENLS